MRVESVEDRPFEAVSYRDSGGGGRIVEKTLPLFHGTISLLPDDLDALVTCGDLQGRGARTSESPAGALLGEILAERLAALAALGRLPSPERTGVILAGDLFVVPDLSYRGGIGDVRPVWGAFADSFRWVVGVAGNHDGFGDDPAAAEPLLPWPRAHLLDGDTRTLDGIRFAGVGGIIGKPTKPNRKGRDRFLRLLMEGLESRPDVLVLHEGPSGPDPRHRGRPEIRRVIEERVVRAQDPPLVVCAHSWWPDVLVPLPSGVQILKVDARVVVLTRPGGSWL